MGGGQVSEKSVWRYLSCKFQMALPKEAHTLYMRMFRRNKRDRVKKRSGLMVVTAWLRVEAQTK